MFFYIAVLLCFIYIFLRLTCGVTRSSACLLGKTALVTGANSGLGYQTVLNLASRGCRVIMADVADMEESKRNVIKYTNNTNIITKTVDLASLQSVRDFASNIRKTEQRLDILINNGGILTSGHEPTVDGLNPVMHINYFSHFLLTHLLVDLLKKSAPSRIVFTSSIGAFFHDLSLDSLNSNDNSDTFLNKGRIYSNSKLAALIAADIFAKKLDGTGVTSNSIHPGIVKTQIYAQGFSAHRSVFWLLLKYLCVNVFGKDVWEGSQTLVHVAVSKKLERVSGKYFWDCVPFVKPPVANDVGFCEEVWAASEGYVQLAASEKL